MDGMIRTSLILLALAMGANSVMAFDLDVVKKSVTKAKEIDADGDNQINLAEFKKAGGKAKYFKKADSDNDGFISIKDAKKQLKRFY